MKILSAFTKFHEVILVGVLSLISILFAAGLLGLLEK